MRILCLNQFFHPDTAATGQILSDLTRELAAQGHEVTVICGKSAYGESDPAAPPPVTIVRSKPLPFSRSYHGRIGSYASYFITAIVQSLRCRRPDVILTLTTPPLLSLVGTLIKHLRGARHFIWEMDLYPDVAVDLGLFGADSLVARTIGSLADYSRDKANGVIALGDDMSERLINRGMSPDKVHVVQNWADRAEIRPHPFQELPLTLYYSGNLGLAHDISTIQQVMLSVAGDDRFKFVFAGGGPQRKTLQDFCEHHGLRQVTFPPYCGRAQLSHNLSTGHLGLVTQKPQTTGSIVPSKVYGIMAAGRPLLYIGSRCATPARIIDHFQCGWQVEAGASEALVALLKRLVNRPDEIREAGARARQAFIDNFDRRIGVARIAAIIGAEPRRAAATA
jgi:glycosyltransferase involved in cell wall biosynthesis